MSPEQILAHLGELEITLVVTPDDHLLVHPASRLPRWLFMEMMLAKPALKGLVRLRGYEVYLGGGVEP